MAPHVDRHPSVRVLLLGDTGVGKSCLASCLASGGPGRANGHTVGCEVHVRLLPPPPNQPGIPPRFVELWDVGGNKEHAALRHLFYEQVHGVIFVHDLCKRTSLASLPGWAAGLGAAGRSAFASHPLVPSPFPASPLSARLAAQGVPVPALVVGAKADAAGHASAAGCGVLERRLLGPLLARLRPVVSTAGRRWRTARRSASLLPESSGPGVRDAELFAACTLRTAAARGRIDAAAFDAFFAGLLAMEAAMTAAPLGAETGEWAEDVEAGGTNGEHEGQRDRMW